MRTITPGQPGTARGRTDEHTGKPKRRRVAAPFAELGRTAAPFLFHAHAVLLAEFVDTAAAVHDLLLAGKERVAQRAHFDAQIFAQGGAGDEAVAAGAGHFDFFILGMDAVFHVYNLKSCPDCRPGAERPGMLRKSIAGRKFWPENTVIGRKLAGLSGIAQAPGQTSTPHRVEELGVALGGANLVE